MSENLYCAMENEDQLPNRQVRRPLWPSYAWFSQYPAYGMNNLDWLSRTELLVDRGVGWPWAQCSDLAMYLELARNHGQCRQEITDLDAETDEPRGSIRGEILVQL